MSGDLEKKIFGTGNAPRLGSTLSVVVLAALAVLFFLISSWILGVIFAAAAALAWFVRSVRRDTRR